MKIFKLLLLISSSLNVFAQNKTLINQKSFFDSELKSWTSSISNFKLSSFKQSEKITFVNDAPQDIETYKKFISIYKPIITYSADKTKFIDIYSYQFNLIKAKNYYKAQMEADQAVFLYDAKTKYWNKIIFNGSSSKVDEVVWISATQFILVGTADIIGDGKNNPQIMIGNTKTQTLVVYQSSDKNCVQSKTGYESKKLKNLNIKY
jgi:hypothetical protein